MALQYQSQSASVSYVLAPYVDKNVRARAVVLDLKSDKPATVYFNVYLSISGSIVQYRATITVSSVWTRYVIGFSQFNNESSTGRSFVDSDMQFIQRITFGAVYFGESGHNNHTLLVDNIKFDNNRKYTAWESTVLS